MLKKALNIPPKYPFHKQINFTPLPWNDYFDDKHFVEIDKNKFNLYFKGKTGPLLFFIHGGGFSGLSWALLIKDLLDIIEIQCISLDLRGHGETFTEDDYNLDIATLSSDVYDVIQKLSQSKDCSNIILVGHSMGGGVAVHVANNANALNIKAVILIDVVEGTAKESLGLMPSFLRSRPKYFKSLDKAIEWSCKSGQIKNTDSARISVPGQLKIIDNPTQFLHKFHSEGKDHQLIYQPIPEETEIMKDVLKIDDVPSALEKIDSPIYTWRAELEKSEKYWNGWFNDLSNMFISLPLDKLLILAGVDHLDKELTIAQMQGKYQLVVLGKCGHSVHEDLPQDVAHIIASFLAKHKYVTFNDTNAIPFQPSC